MATSVELYCPIEAVVGGSITLSKTSLRSCKLVPREIEVQDTSTNGDNDSNDELAEKIGRSNISALMRSSRRVIAPARYYDFL